MLYTPSSLNTYSSTLIDNLCSPRSFYLLLLFFLAIFVTIPNFAMRGILLRRVVTAIRTPTSSKHSPQSSPYRSHNLYDTREYFFLLIRPDTSKKVVSFESYVRRPYMTLHLPTQSCRDTSRNPIRPFVLAHLNPLRDIYHPNIPNPSLRPRIPRIPRLVQLTSEVSASSTWINE